MQTISAQTISAKLLSLHCRNGYRADQYFSWMLDDVLADLTRQKKANPPPVEVMPDLFELGRLYAQAVTHDEPFTDILGAIYMDLASHGSKQALGQYFTPACVARMMARMTYEKRENERLISCCDPACGSGVMMLQMAAEILEQEGPYGLERYSFVGVDLDAICARMFAAQMLANTYLHGMNYGELLVYRGNSLGAWVDLEPVVHAALPEREREILPATHPDRVEMVREQVTRRNESEQLSLFA